MPKRVFTSTDGYVTRDLIQGGIDHIASAKVLFKSGFRCFDSAGYLVHLGLELLLKSLLLHTTGQFLEGHSLIALKERVVEILPQFDAALPNDLVATFEEFKALRYPIPQGLPEIGTSDWIAFEDTFPKFIGAAPETWLAELYAIEGNLKAGRVLMVKDISQDSEVSSSPKASTPEA